MKTLIKAKEYRMHHIIRVILILLLALITSAALMSCASTSIKTSWHDESFSKDKLGKVFVISLMNNEVRRRMAEDEFVRQLQREGIAAIRSYALFPKLKDDNKNEVIEAIKREGCSTVLVSKPLDIQMVTNSNTQTVYTGRWYTHNWYNYYREAYTVSNDVTVTLAKSDTAVYDMQTEKLLWSVLTETELTDTPSGKDIEQGVMLVIKSLLGR